jgi:predicted DNA-binding transcriptional regulator AlpA
MQTDEYLTVRQLEARSNISASTWNKRRLSGDSPPFLKIGKKVLYRWSDVEAWLAGRTRTSTSGRGADAA